jgi:hypothetical protein
MSSNHLTSPKLVHKTSTTLDTQVPQIDKSYKVAKFTFTSYRPQPQVQYIEMTSQVYIMMKSQE